MKKLLSILLIGTLFIVSCKKSDTQPEDTQKTTTTNTTNTVGFPTKFQSHHLQKGSFGIIGACSPNGTEWSLSSKNDVWTSNGITYIDSLNYMIREPLPITITNDSTISFNSYTCTNSSYIINSGVGNIKFDTLYINVNAKTTSIPNCSNTPVTFKGKYYKIP